MLDDSGMESKPHPSEPLPLNQAARCLRVPAQWLRDEVEAGKLPGLKAGRAILIHVPTVAAALTERAKAEHINKAEGGAA